MVETIKKVLPTMPKLTTKDKAGGAGGIGGAGFLVAYQTNISNLWNATFSSIGWFVHYEVVPDATAIATGLTIMIGTGIAAIWVSAIAKD